MNNQSSSNLTTVSISDLVQDFHSNIQNYKSTSYNETQLRDDFLNKFLKILGWDIDNSANKSQHIRDVLQEESISVEGEKSKKSPDYTLRIEGIRQLFVEAKKPSVNIEKSAKSAFQIRRYGWNAGLNISILSNFEYLIIYDCNIKPDSNDNEKTARYKIFHYLEYENKINEIRDLISFQSICDNSTLSSSLSNSHKETFDDYFLKQISKWRISIASAIYEKNLIPDNDLNLITQRIINRIIFLRICEDRNIEKIDSLKNISTYEDFRSYLEYADNKYNSGLFEIIDDHLELNKKSHNELFSNIFKELYYPVSPYDFSVIDSAILSQIYEQFLGDRIDTSSGIPKIIQEAEVSASKGVVSTPPIISKNIASSTLDEVTKNKDLNSLRNIKIADICCGSGVFLLSAYEYMINITLEKLIEEKIFNTGELTCLGDDQYTLNFKGKRNILLNNIHGVDINPYAVEVSTFSLLVKLLEGEDSSSINSYIKTNSGKILPNLEHNIKHGNSLIDDNYFSHNRDSIRDPRLISKISPFNWNENFNSIIKGGGFDAIIGNPPYVRIQNLVKHTPEEISYYKSSTSNYRSIKSNNIDKYYIFIERALQLLKEGGHLSYIIPSKFGILKGGEKIRELITKTSNIFQITHFGSTQVFKNHSTYTEILHLTKSKASNIFIKKIDKISINTLNDNKNRYTIPQDSFNKNPWIITSKETKEIFDKIKSVSSTTLKDTCNIFVGLQTSNDKVFIFTPQREDETYYYLSPKEHNHKIEKTICIPCIYDLSFNFLEPIKPNAIMIFPYITSNEKAELISKDKFKADFPHCWDYLKTHKEELLKRNFTTKNPKWYQFGRTQSLVKFDGREKLIWPVLSTKPNYTIDKENISFTGGGNGPYYALSKKSDLSLEYIAAILGHPVIEKMVKLGASEFRGDYYSHGKQFIEKVPIIIPTSESELSTYNSISINMADILILNKSLEKSHPLQKKIQMKQIDILKAESNSLVSKLYKLSINDTSTVLNEDLN